MVELSTGGRQSLLVATGVHGEAAVTAAPVVAVGGEAEGIFGKEKNIFKVLTVITLSHFAESFLARNWQELVCTLQMCSGAGCSTPGRHRCRTGGGCRRSTLWTRGRGSVCLRCSVDIK